MYKIQRTFLKQNIVKQLFPSKMLFSVAWFGKPLWLYTAGVTYDILTEAAVSPVNDPAGTHSTLDNCLESTGETHYLNDGSFSLSVSVSQDSEPANLRWKRSLFILSITPVLFLQWHAKMSAVKKLSGPRKLTMVPSLIRLFVQYAYHFSAVAHRNVCTVRDNAWQGVYYQELVDEAEARTVWQGSLHGIYQFLIMDTTKGIILLYHGHFSKK